MEITTTHDLETYLMQQTSLPPHTSLQPLTGGMGNFVWRMHLPPAHQPPRTLILKHAEPFLAADRSFPLPPERMDHEHAALTELPALLQDTAEAPAAAAMVVVTTPAVRTYDPTHRVLVLEDAGATTLKDAYSGSLDVPALGRALGAWLAVLHLRTRTLRFAAVGDNAVGREVCRYSYARLAAALEGYGFDGGLGRRVDGKYGALLRTEDGVVCHGDFWPGNVLLAAASSSSSSSSSAPSRAPESSQERPLQTMAVIDWEGCRRGNPATDLAQFAAEAYLLDHFRGGHGLLPAFVGAYCERLAEDGGEVDWERVAVHLAVHLVFWTGTVGWGPKAEEAEVVRLGMQILEGVEAGGWDGGKDELLKRLIG